MKKIFTLFLLTFFSVSFVSAQRLLSEDFNYTPGNLTGNNAWKTFLGSQNPVYIQVVSGNLSYPGYVSDTTTSSSRVMLDTARKNGEAAFARFTSQKTGTIYCSFLLNVLNDSNLVGGNSATGEYFVSLLPNVINSPSYAALQIKRGKRGATFNLGIAARVDSTGSSPVSWADSNYSVNNVYLVTIAYQVVAGDNNNVVSLWVNPRTDSAQGTAQATATDTDAGGDTINIGKVGLFQNSIRTPMCLIDALRVGLSWNDVVLPLQLLSFNVIDNNGFAGLSWQTCNETNVKVFEIQRSADARNFVAIANLAAKNGSCGTTYTYRDAKELAGTAFYRIRVVDNDGQAFYSAVVSISGKVPAKISVFPNPVVNNLVLSHPKAADDAVIKIVSLNGSLVASHKVQKDAVQTSVDVSKLAKGNYIVIFHNAQQLQTIKILKQ
jgi:hypothetical protein